MNEMSTEGGSGKTVKISENINRFRLGESWLFQKTKFLAAAWVCLLMMVAGSVRAQCDDPLSVTVSCDPVLCHGDSNGYAEGRIYGGTPPYTVRLDGPVEDSLIVSDYSGSFEFNDLIGGNYTVTVWDANYDFEHQKGCKAIGTAYIGEPPLLEMELSSDTVFCAGSLGGAISGTVSGGTPPYNVRLSGDAAAVVKVDASGDQFEFAGLAAGNYTVTVRDAYYLTNQGSGCKLSEQTTIINQDQGSVVDSIAASICAGDTYDFNGQILSEEGEYRDTVTNSAGCDSVLLLTLNVFDFVEVDSSAIICLGDSFPFNGQDLTSSGTYLDTLSSTGDCDTLIRLLLIVKESLPVDSSATICLGDSFLFNGQELTTAGVYLDTLASDGGCDTLLRLTLTVTEFFEVDSSATICDGASFMFNGQELTTAGTYLDTLASAGSCDTLIRLMLTVTEFFEVDSSATICDGASFMFNGQELTTAGVYLDTLASDAGCDTLLRLALTVTEFFEVDSSATICDGASFMFNGQELTTAGTYLDTLASAGSCDTLIRLMLAVTEFFEVDSSATICGGASFAFNGQELTAAGTYLDTIPSASSCDTLIRLMLTVTEFFEVDSSATICGGDSFTFNGQELTTAGTYLDTIPSTSSCDTLLRLTLTVTEFFEVDSSATICDGESFAFNGQELTTAGTYLDTIPSASSCDTLLRLMLTVTEFFEVDSSATICDGASFTFNGQELTAAGTYLDTIPSTSSCDTLLRLMLTVTEFFEVDSSATICDGASFTFNGQELTAAGTYLDTIPSAGSCDTLIRLMLTVSEFISVDSSATICDGESFTFNGQELTTAGTYLDTLASASSCDTLIRLTLTVTEFFEVDSSATICDGESFTFNGQELTTAGTYLDTIASTSSCDTLIRLTLTVTEFFEVDSSATICEGESFTFNGQELTTAGTYLDTLASASSCDTLIRLMLTVTEFFEVDSSATICEGESFTFNGQDLTAAGTYLDTIPSASSCDTLIRLILTVSEFISVDSSAMICAGESFTFNGQDLTSTGTYLDTLPSATSCDTLIRLLLTVTEFIPVDSSATICAGDSFAFNDVDLTMAGTYLDTLPAASGCDTLIRLLLTVDPSPDAMLSPMDSVWCGNPENVMLTLINNDPQQILTFEWAPDFAILTNPPDTTTVSVDILEADSFYVYLSNQFGCLDTLLTVFTEEICPDSIMITSDQMNPTVCLGDEVTLTVESDCVDCTYEWSTGETGPSITVASDTTTIFTVSAISANDCQCDSAAEIELTVEDCPDLECVPESFFLPSAFTPNGDMVNDEFCLRTLGDPEGVEISMTLTIYDRWGEAVFHTDTFGDCWDGTYQGAALAQDVYVYILNIVCPDEGPIELRGDVVLLR